MQGYLLKVNMVSVTRILTLSESIITAFCIPLLLQTAVKIIFVLLYRMDY